MREHGVDAIRAQLLEAHEGESFDPALLEGLSDEQAAALLGRVLEAMNVSLSSGTRPPEAIVGRLIRKLRREDPQPRVEQALELLNRLCQIQGSPAEALTEATNLLTAHGLPTMALDELRAILALLNAHGIAAKQISLDFGLGRGLHYYTGMIFEVYSSDGLQLCGGGRYDDLVTALGGRQGVPAVGCAYGLERLVAAAAPALHAQENDVLVVAVADEDYSYALEVAHTLRQSGYAASVDLRARGVAASLRDATRRGTTFAAIVGTEERTQARVVWRDLARREEQRIKLDELPVYRRKT